MSYLYDFYLGETAVEIRLFRTFGIFRIPYNNIANVWEIRFLQGFPDKEASLASRIFTLAIGNRMTTRAVLIKRKNSVSKYVVISPRHPSIFVSEIRSKMLTSPASQPAKRRNHKSDPPENSPMSMDRTRNIYKTTVVVVSKTISIGTIMVGFVIALCVVADNIFGLGWGYPWWSFLFCIVYIAVAIAINRSISGFVGYIDRLRNGDGTGDSSV